MSFLYEADGQVWRLYTDKDGIVHREPVQPAPETALECCDD
jgi:hypothetical protein